MLALWQAKLTLQAGQLPQTTGLHAMNTFATASAEIQSRIQKIDNCVGATR